MQTDNQFHTLEPFLAEHPFFHDIPDEYRHLVTECASNMRVDAGQFLFREGDPADHLYLIRSGQIALECYAPNRGAIVIQTLSDGDVIGWSWLVPPHRSHFDARAVEPTRVIALDGDCLRRKCQTDPRLGYTFIKKTSQLLVDRLNATTTQLLEAYDGNPTS